MRLVLQLGGLHILKQLVTECLLTQRKQMLIGDEEERLSLTFSLRCFCDIAHLLMRSFHFEDFTKLYTNTIWNKSGVSFASKTFCISSGGEAPD